MNEYKIIELRSGTEKVIVGGEMKVINYLRYHYAGDVQKILRHKVRVTVRLEGDTDFKEFSTEW